MASNFTFNNYTLDNHSVSDFSHNAYALSDFTYDEFANPDYANEVKIFNNTPAVEIPGRINSVAEDLRGYLNHSINDDTAGIKGYVNKTINGNDGLIPYVNKFVNDENEGMIPYLNELMNDDSVGMIKHVNDQVQSITSYINEFINGTSNGFIPYLNGLMNGPQGIVNYVNGLNEEVRVLKEDFINSTKAYVAEQEYGYTTTAINRALLNERFEVISRDEFGNVTDFKEGNKRTFDCVYNESNEMLTYSVEFVVGTFTTTATYEIIYDVDRNVEAINELTFAETEVI